MHSLRRLAVVSVLVLGAMAVTSPRTSTELAQAAPAATAMPMPGMGGGPAMNGTGSCPRNGGVMDTAKTPAERAMAEAMMGAMNHSATMGSGPMAWSGNPDLDYVTMALHHARTARALARVELRFGKDRDAIELAQATIDAQNAEIAKLKAMLDSMHR